MDLAARMVGLGQRLLSGRFRAPTSHWQDRVWDGYRAEVNEALGSAYREEREAIGVWLAAVAPDRCVLDVATGTGRYAFDAARAGARHVVALDVSKGALEQVAARALDQGLDEVVTTRLGDFWGVTNECACGCPFELVICLDAIHHLGPIPKVLARLDELAGAEGSVVGDVWTRDHFGEFQRARRGSIAHLAASARFLLQAGLIALGVRATADAVRSDLRPGQEVAALSATLENEADATCESEATGSSFLVCRVLGFDAGQGVDAAVA